MMLLNVRSRYRDFDGRMHFRDYNYCDDFDRVHLQLPKSMTQSWHNRRFGCAAETSFSNQNKAKWIGKS
jgi:hypothetical protein